jgi:hypothetical protein
MYIFLPRGKKFVWRIFFIHFTLIIFFPRAVLPLAYKKQMLPLVGSSKKYLSVNYCDFLTPTDTVTENPQAAEILIQPVGMVLKCTQDAQKVYAPLVMVSFGAM